MSEFHYVSVEEANASDVLEPIPSSSRESYSWTDDNAFKLIQYRIQYKELFNRKKGSATLGYRKIAENLGIDTDNYNCVKKKWENMVDKFRQEIKKIIYGFEIDSQPYLRSTWRYYDAMCNALGYEREVNRIKSVSMMNTNLSSASTSPQLDPSLIEPRKRFRSMQTESMPLPASIATSALQSQLQSSEPLASPTDVVVKIESSDFEFDTMFVQDEQDSTVIDSLIVKEEMTIEDSEMLHINTTEEQALIASPLEVPKMCTTDMTRDVKNNLSAAVASTSQAQVYPAGVVQSNHAAASDALSSCSSSDDTTDAPCNKKSSTSKRGKKRKRQEDDDIDKLWEYIKKGDEEIRSDFKQLIEIQRQTSEHIGTLVNYLINKNN